MYAGHGSRSDRSRLDAARGAALSGAAVAAARRGVSLPDGGKQPERGPAQATCVHAAGFEGVTRDERVDERP